MYIRTIRYQIVVGKLVTNKYRIRSPAFRVDFFIVHHRHEMPIMTQSQNIAIFRDQLNSRFHGRDIFREIGLLP